MKLRNKKGDMTGLGLFLTIIFFLFVIGLFVMIVVILFSGVRETQLPLLFLIPIRRLLKLR